MSTTSSSTMMLTAGVDVGSAVIKMAILETDETGVERLVVCRGERIRRRDTHAVAEALFTDLLQETGIDRGALGYVATTGEGETIPFRTGHFYGMTTHARGGLFLEPEARAIIDMGALHTRAVAMDDRSKVTGYRMTSQCASGSGQFLENIARYLGVSLEEVGTLSLQADNPEACSSICAVLAETDVINMVSRGIATEDILKGIHLSMAGRLAKLLKVTGITKGTVLLTGGLALDTGLLAALQEELVNEKITGIEAVSHPDSIYAGAIGAALWGAFRHHKLRELQSRAAA